MLALITQGISLGFSAGAIPGPFISYLVSTTLAQGWRRTIKLIFVPPVGDIPIIIIVVVVLRQIPPQFIRGIQLIGGLYLLWIAYGAYRQMRAGVMFDAGAPTPERSFFQGILMAWLGPGPYLYWSTILGPLLISALNESVGAGAAFLLSFYLPFLLLLAGYVILFDRLRRLDPRIVRGIQIVVIIILVLFALRLIAQGVGIL
jgi:threonine/homoserine/homoserine lactone efflux protein